MKVKEILSFSASLIGDDRTEKLLTGEALFNPADGESEIEKYLNAYNCLSHVIAGEYLPLVNKKQFSNVKEIPFSALEGSCVQVVSAVDFQGKSAVYKLTQDGMIFDKTHRQITVEYSYLPTPFSLEDECVFISSGKMSVPVLCYGVIAEYLMHTGAREEASVWQEKFLRGMLTVKKPRHKRVMKGRGWL